MTFGTRNLFQALALPAMAVLLSACAQSTPKAEEAALISDGRDIAEAHCAACHAVGTYGESPNPAAPPLRTVFGRLNPAALEDDLINGIKVAHPMPDFQFNPQGVDVLLAYLRSIQQTPPPQK